MPPNKASKKRVTDVCTEVLAEVEKPSNIKNGEMITAIEAEAWRMRLRGATYKEIGDHFGLAMDTARNIIDRLHMQLAVEMFSDTKRFRELLQFKLLKLAHDCEEIFEDKRKINKITTWDLQYVEQSRKLIADVCKMMGLYEPQEVKHSADPDNPPFQVLIKVD